MKPIFEMSSNTRLLRQRLLKASIGETVSYSELSSLVSQPLSKIRPAMYSAINSLLRHEHLRFAAVRGVGLKRLNDAEIVAASDQGIDGIRRKAKKEAMRITAVQNFAGLVPRDQLAHTTRLSIFTAISAMSSTKGIAKVAAAATGRASELPISATLAAFIASG